MYPENASPFFEKFFSGLGRALVVSLRLSSCSSPGKFESVPGVEVFVYDGSVTHLSCPLSLLPGRSGALTGVTLLSYYWRMLSAPAESFAIPRDQLFLLTAPSLFPPFDTSPVHVMAPSNSLLRL